MAVLSERTGRALEMINPLMKARQRERESEMRRRSFSLLASVVLGPSDLIIIDAQIGSVIHSSDFIEMQM